MGNALEPSSARRARRKASLLQAEQRQQEQEELATREDEVARSKAVAASGKAGRSSLIRSAPSGLSTNLGGT